MKRHAMWGPELNPRMEKDLSGIISDLNKVG